MCMRTILYMQWINRNKRLPEGVWLGRDSRVRVRVRAGLGHTLFRESFILVDPMQYKHLCFYRPVVMLWQKSRVKLILHQ